MSRQVALFLAHSIALEHEAADRYAELADTMEVHNNPDVAQLFRQMSQFSRQHAQSVEERAVPFQPLPVLKSWEYRWNAPQAPEVGDFTGTHYLMSPWHALHFALENEKRGYEFYRGMCGSDDPDVQKLAADFTSEEDEHVKELEQWLARTPQPEQDWDEDPDPALVAD